MIIPIHHSLMGKCTRSEIKEIHSKPQALSQCRHWLSKHVPGVRLVEATSTAAAAQIAKTQPGAAAIASRLAAEAYDLEILAQRLEDRPNNTTRFAILGKEDAPRSRKAKTTLMFELPHEPGSLADAMAIFKRGKINLTWIESLPNPETPGTYVFFADLAGHRAEMKVRRALSALEKRASRLIVLGSYPICERNGENDEKCFKGG
ncbi:MAG: prephenate dehydratase domain-containing protein, partial [Planctomycetia bacterium]|nr:prephenate dehydratase domain-containing protein [Planctomycetia bacterium]